MMSFASFGLFNRDVTRLQRLLRKPWEDSRCVLHLGHASEVGQISRAFTFRVEAVAVLRVLEKLRDCISTFLWALVSL